MAKVVVWGGMLLLVLGGLFTGLRALNADPGELVGLAIGEVDAKKQCPLQVVVTPMMTARDAPYKTVTPDSRTIDWAFWADAHFKVTDAGGRPVRFEKHGFRSKDISETQFGSGEQIVVAPLQAGQDYNFTYIRTLGEPEQYTLKIKAEPTEFRRKTFAADY